MACAFAATGCGSSSSSTQAPNAAEMSRLRAHLADAQAAATNHDRAAATAALNALGNDVALLRRRGVLTATQANVLSTDVAQARNRAQIEIPLPVAPAAAVAPPATTAQPPAPPAQPQDSGNGKPKDNGNGKPKDHGNGGDNGKGPKKDHKPKGGGGNGGD